MAKRGDRLRVGVPISAPRTELKGASERAERSRAARVRRRARGERLAVCEDEFEVLAARSLHLLRVRVVPVRECLQERAGRRVGGIGGARSGALMGVVFERDQWTEGWRKKGRSVLGSSRRRSFGCRMRWWAERVPVRLPASRTKSEDLGGSIASRMGGALTLNLCCCKLSESSNAASSMSS